MTSSDYIRSLKSSFNGYEDTTNEVSILKVIHESTDGLYLALMKSLYLDLLMGKVLRYTFAYVYILIYGIDEGPGIGS